MTKRLATIREHLRTPLLLALFVWLPATLVAQTVREQPRVEEAKPLPVSPGWLKPLTWRNIGPAAMSGRIVALSVYEADPSLYWVATASGGLLKTVNNGVTFEHQFDREATVSVGDVAVAPSDKNIVWVGTGENNPRNSVSYGDGVYKSTDGGATWKNMGLKETFQIGKILVHPTQPNTVYVGALGRLYGPNKDRGVYKTIDGGNSWEKILFVDDKTGVIDMRFHPTQPDTILVATYERQRDGYDFNDPAKKWGKGAGIYRTTNGGKTWSKMTKGLPTNQLGRIGLDWYRKNPNVVFAIVECEKIGGGTTPVAQNQVYMGITGQDAAGGGAELTRVTEGGPAAKAGLKTGDVIAQVNDQPIKGYEDLIRTLRDKKVGDKIKIARRRGKETVNLELTLAAREATPTRPGTGANPERPFAVSLGGQRENVQDQQGPNGFEYGGIYRSDDAGETWRRINSLNPRPMYFSQVRVDPQDDRYVYVLGISLYRSKDGGKTFTADGGRRVHADQHALWINPKDGRHMVLGTDGGHYVTYDRMENWDHLNTATISQFYHVAVDSRRDYRVYGGLQDNGSWGGPSLTRSTVGPINEDWFRVGGGDGFTCRVASDDPDLIYFTSQNGAMGRRNLRTRESASIRPTGRERYRFNWNTPFILSAHNPRIFYAGGNVVFRSLDRGNNLTAISPNLTSTDRGSATAVAESPKNPNVLWAGTDDGYLWVTKDGGREWINVTKNVGLPGLRWVNAIEASRVAEERAYVVFDGHRSDDDRPYVYVTEDLGKTWKPLHTTLPSWGTTRVLREDLENPNLLYLGTEFGILCSLDRGINWTSLNNNLPTVAIHEIALHSSAGEMVVATHGRGLWIVDVSALRQMNTTAVESKHLLFKPVSAIRWATDVSRGGTNRRFVGDNPPRGAALYYYLKEKVGQISLKVVDINGKTVRELTAQNAPGLHKIQWDLTQPPQRVNAAPGGQRPVPGGQRLPQGGQGAAPGAGQIRGVTVPAGTYLVVLTVDGVSQSQVLKIENDPTAPESAIASDDSTETEENKPLTQPQLDD